MSRVVTVFPNKEKFEGSISDFYKRSEQYFKQFTEYCYKWKNILDILNLNLCFLKPEQFDLSWKNDIERLYSDKEFHDKIIFEHDFSDLNEPLKSFFQESFNLTFERKKEMSLFNQKQYKCLSAETSADKCQEVLYLTNALNVLLKSCYSLDNEIIKEGNHETIEELLSHIDIKDKVPLKRENLHFVDVGAGKGFLPIFLCDELNIKSLSIEASISHSRQFIERVAILSKGRRLDVSKFDKYLRMCIGWVTENTNIEALALNSISYKKWAATVLSKDKEPLIKMKQYLLPESELDDSLIKEEAISDVSQIKGIQTTKPRVIQGELAHEILAAPTNAIDLSPLETFCVSIHACGDLSVLSHEIALNSKQCRGAISVPCCFQHLTLKKCPLYPQNNKLFDFLFEGSETFRKDFLNHALSTYYVPFEKRNETIKGFLPREYYAKFIPLRQSVKKVKRMKGETDVQYFKRIAYSVGGHTDITDEDIVASIKEVNDNVWRLQAQQIFREFFGHAFETFILLDRLCYYAILCQKREEATGDKYLIGMFDVMSPFSPRAFSQFSIKIN